MLDRESDIVNYWKPREIERLELLRAEGLTLKAIAIALGRSFRSVAWQVRNLGIQRTEIAWTQERIGTLMRLHAAGDSFRVIGHALGISRNAAIGKAQRLNLPGREPRKAPHSPVKIRKTRFQAKVPAIALAPERLPPAPSGAPEPHNLTILELEPGDCKWPVNDGPSYLFCGHAAVRETPCYCAYHDRLAHQPRRDRMGTL